MSDKKFRISQRHYNLIIQQCKTNYPQECGGFLGGQEFLIQAVLPTFNQHLYNKTDTYALHQEDFNRAREFFKKHGVSYYGVYHSHPKGVAYPSDADIKTGQKYHFIVGLRDVDSPIFAAFEIQGRTVIPIPIDIVPDAYFSVVDIYKGSGLSQIPKGVILRDPISEAKMLGEFLENIRNSKPQYPKMDPINLESDFSTLA